MIVMFLLGLFGGLSATPHCLAMCGSFPLHLGRSTKKGSTVLRQLLFLTGKTCTYIFLGAVAGALGTVLFKDTAAARLIPTVRMTAGCLMLIFGISMLGFRLPSLRSNRKATSEIVIISLLRGLFRGLLISPTPISSFILGLAVGYLPCPLPLGMLAVAAVSHSVVAGMIIMAGVGLGTSPGLLGLGLFGAGIFGGAKQRSANTASRIAGVIVIIFALLTVLHAAGVNTPLDRTIPSCCREHR